MKFVLLFVKKLCFLPKDSKIFQKIDLVNLIDPRQHRFRKINYVPLNKLTFVIAYHYLKIATFFQMSFILIL